MTHIGVIENSDLFVAIIAAFVADVISLMFQTPADTLALRLQLVTAHDRREKNDEVPEALAHALEEARIEEKVGNWLWESLERLPTVVLTDLPYLLTRIALNGVIIQGQTIDIGHYEVATFSSAVVCAFLTTPFDVARTRILIVKAEGADKTGLVHTFRAIVKEGGGGVRNLFAGWLERTTYLGISSLWLPFALVIYIAIRDAILLEWFD